MEYFTIQQLSRAVDRTPRTIREHISQQWLKAEKIPGAKGWRIRATDATRWAAKYLAKNISETTSA